MGIVSEKTLKLWSSIVFGSLVGFVIVFVSNGFDVLYVETIRSIIRRTGRMSFLFFLVPLVATPLHYYFKSNFTQFLVNNRKYFGLAFAGNHIWHLTYIIALYNISIETPEPMFILVGGLFAMFFLFLMTVFSFPIPIKTIGIKITQMIHFFGLYILIGTFFYDIVIRNWQTPNFILLTLLFSALIVRLLYQKDHLPAFLRLK